MSNQPKPLLDYIHALEKEVTAGNATEHTHRPTLKTLVETLGEKVTATNEPWRIKCGAPDIIITQGAKTIGYIETKDIDKSLDEAEKTDQIKRYKDSLSNFILTDYLEFRWFIDGKLQLKARLGATANDKIKYIPDNLQQVNELLKNFLQHQAEGVGTPKELALRMARIAHLIRNLIINTFAMEVQAGSLHAQLAAFRENLIPDLSDEQFADMYAQTIVYGLFAARCNTDNAQNFTRQNALYLLPRTNPFLQNLFIYIAGPKLDDTIAWSVDELVQILAQADMAEVLKDFGKQMGKEDPVVHFYETFLKAYDPTVREMRGVYYTPEPVVSYIVRSIDHLLKIRFNKPQGLVDPETLILDPAVGTATFLYKVIDEIHHSFVSQGQQGVWNNYVAEKLLPRLFGFELLMAPYAIAHFKLGLQLKDSGYNFHSNQRLGIYLTNTLEEGFKKAEQLAGFNEYIVEEANAAAEIKKEKPIMVILGNPPYSGASSNKGEWITKLINTYKTVDGKPLGEKNSKWLQDDYVKFIRFGQWRIDRTGKGVLGFITNHAYLDNPTFRGMRQSLLNSFTDIYILNLHGNSKKKETAPDGSKDENVFDIQQGVAIGILIKEPDKKGPAKIHYADLWGLRENKYQVLSETDLESTHWFDINPNTPNYFFIPQNEILRPEYEKGWKITEIFPVNSIGFVTSRDKFVIDYSHDELSKRISVFRGNDLNDDEIKQKYDLREKEDWDIANARNAIRLDNNWEKSLVQCLYRPFDLRTLFYYEKMVERTRKDKMRHMIEGSNIGLCTNREVNGAFHHSLCSKYIINDCTVSLQTKERTYLFPLYLYPSEQEVVSGLYKVEDRRPNLNPEFVKVFSDRLGLKFIEDGKGDLKETFGPEDIFNFAYAVLHSPTYRVRYAEFLKIDFPRLPLTSSKGLFKSLAEKGAELVALHLMESPVLNNLITKFPNGGSNIVEKVEYKEIKSEETQAETPVPPISYRVHINKGQYFEGVPPEVWNFHIGGYQVCEKWLKDRKGRNLAYDDITHYQKIVVALKETVRLMAEVDKIIPTWPIE